MLNAGVPIDMELFIRSDGAPVQKKPLVAKQKPRRKLGGYWLGLLSGLVLGVGLGGLGTTFASNITLNSNNPIEFGQGTVSVQACDPQIDIVPEAVYDAGDGGDYWILQYLYFKNIDVAACSGKNFTLSFTAGIPGGGSLGYDPTLRPYKFVFAVDFVEDSSTPGYGAFWSGKNPVSSTHLFIDGYEVDQAYHGFGAEFRTDNVSATAQNGGFTITTRVLAADIGRILLETSDR
jgi:hypothetical protein